MDKTPRAADSIVAFGDTGGASVLRYNLPLPGRVTGKRLVKLDLGLQAADYLPYNAVADPRATRLQFVDAGGGVFNYNITEALAYFREELEGATNPSNTLWRAAMTQFIPRVATDNSAMVTQLADLSGQAKLDAYTHAMEQLSPWGNNSAFRQMLHHVLPTLIQLYQDYRAQLNLGKITVIQETSPSVYAVVATSHSIGTPNIYLVETYGISTFLGDYGLGRTLATFSLLPGEETKIFVKTWRTDTVVSKESTSIIDSYTSEAAQSHKQDVQDETTSKSSQADKLSWHVDAEVSASWGWGNAKVTGGAAGDHQTARESFARGMQAATEEHAFKASSNRSNTVSSDRTSTTTTGAEQSTERTIKNINLRRVLNFVFRELTQDYITKIHLMDVKVAFSNGPAGVWDEVDIPQLRGLLDRRVVAGPAVNTAATAILRALNVAMDSEHTPVTCLQVVTANVDGSITISPVVPNSNGNLPVPPSDYAWMYRFRPGALGQTDTFAVDGVVVRKFNVTMRTESIVCEALLGQADALDPYAVAQQYEDAESKHLENKRAALVLNTLENIADPTQRAAAYASIFNPPAPLAAK